MQLESISIRSNKSLLLQIAKWKKEEGYELELRLHRMRGLPASLCNCLAGKPKSVQKQNLPFTTHNCY